MMAFLKKLFTKTAVLEADVIAPSREQAPQLFARIFAGDDGARALAYLRASVNGRVGGPQSTEAALRYFDGQRGLLQTICGLVEQGRG